MLQFSVALDIVLSTSEVPHEVAPVHEVTLVTQEESDVLQLCGHLHGHGFATAIVWHFRTIDTTHPRLVG